MRNTERKEINPPHNLPVREKPSVTKQRLFEYHRAQVSMETYYDMYPGDLPPDPAMTRQGRV